MKVSLILLLAVVTVSFCFRQQIQLGDWPFYYYPMLRMMYQQYPPVDNINSGFREDYEMNWPQQMSRNKASNNDRYNRPASLPTSSKLEEEQDHRLFGSGDRFNPFQAMIRTVIVTTTTTSSILAATITTCIPANLFVAPVPPALNVTYCTKKKKREAALLWNDEDIVQPSTVQQVMATPVPLLRNNIGLVPDLHSSREDLMEDYRSNGVELKNNRKHRAFFRFIVTSVTTATSYVFNSTLIKKTLLLAGSTSVLTCVPYGFGVC